MSTIVSKSEILEYGDAVHLAMAHFPPDWFRDQSVRTLGRSDATDAKEPGDHHCPGRGLRHRRDLRNRRKLASLPSSPARSRPVLYQSWIDKVARTHGEHKPAFSLNEDAFTINWRGEYIGPPPDVIAIDEASMVNERIGEVSQLALLPAFQSTTNAALPSSLTASAAQ